MTLQQLRYIIQVAESGSITAAASVLYMRQPSLSKSISELEHELGITIFERSVRGISVTAEGDRLLAYARQVVEQADLLEAHYVGAAGQRRAFGVSVPHNLRMTEAFAEIVRELDDERYEFTLREVPPAMVIEDVRQQRSEIGVIYRSAGRQAILEEALREGGLRFTPFGSITPRVLVSKDHPLSERDEVAAEELLGYPRIMLEWVSASRSGSVGPLVELPKAPRVVRTTDRETQRRLMRMLDGYMLFLPLLKDKVVEAEYRALHIVGATPVEAGFITRPGFPLSPSAVSFQNKLLELGS